MLIAKGAVGSIRMIDPIASNSAEKHNIAACSEQLVVAQKSWNEE
tara:strand:- start:55 stop:189 length:135 start_codon:yes stop_codon:yes gene_type:complete